VTHEYTMTAAIPQSDRASVFTVGAMYAGRARLGAQYGLRGGCGRVDQPTTVMYGGTRRESVRV